MLKAAASKKFMKNSIPGDDYPGLFICMKSGIWQLATVNLLAKMDKKYRVQGFEESRFQGKRILSQFTVVPE
jgi:hypothetical protein